MPPERARGPESQPLRWLCGRSSGEGRRPVFLAISLMRLFVGLKLPKKLKMRIHGAARPLREERLPVRWIDPENFHVTLKFLGDVRNDHVEPIREALSGVAGATRAFSTGLGGFGAFPTIRRPRVVWIGVEASSELRCLKQDIEWTLGSLGFRVETRSFHPHVTLGRVDTSYGAGVFRGLDARLAAIAFSGELSVHRLDLIQSRLSPTGARYTSLCGLRLGCG